MNKKYTYGAIALTVLGTGLIGTSLYAADALPTTVTNALQQKVRMHNQKAPEDIIASLSGSVSAQALAEFKTLMDTHKTQMDALKASGSGATQLDRTAFEKIQTEHKANLDALLKKYPDLQTALNNTPFGKMGRGGFGGERGDNYLSTLPTEVTQKIQTIRDSYEKKHQELRTQENTEVLAALESYPEAKKAFQERIDNENTMKSEFGRNGPGGGFEKGQMGRGGRGGMKHDRMSESQQQGTSQNSNETSAQ